MGDRQERGIVQDRDRLRSQRSLSPRARQRLDALEKEAKGITRRLFWRRSGTVGKMCETEDVTGNMSSSYFSITHLPVKTESLSLS